MKKIIISFIGLLISILSLAVEPKEYLFHFKLGGGYFGDITQFLSSGYGTIPDWAKVNPEVEGHIFHGQGVFVETGYLMKTGFDISLWVQAALTNYAYNDPFGVFWDKKRSEYFYIGGIMLSKDFLKYKKSQFNFGVGLAIRNYRGHDTKDLFDPTKTYNDSNFPSLERFFWDLGSVIKLEYEYQLTSNLKVGLNTNANLVWQLGFETVSVNPYLTFLF